MVWTEEQSKKILQVRLIIGDSAGSPFYPLFEDEEIAQFLELNNWSVRPATRMAAMAASMNFAQMVYRERAGDVEVWNNVSIQYQKALERLISNNDVSNFGVLRPYFGGIDKPTVAAYAAGLDNVRSPLATAGEYCSFINGQGIVFFLDKTTNVALGKGEIIGDGEVIIEVTPPDEPEGDNDGISA